MSPGALVVGISTSARAELALLGDDLDIASAAAGGALESLSVMLEEALSRARATIADVTLIGVCTGPGSFTGLRIGIAFAKSLAQANDIPIAGASSYEIAEFATDAIPIVSVARGKRDHYYARLVTGGKTPPRFVQGTRAAIEQAAAELGSAGTPAPIVGPDFWEAPAGAAARAAAQLARRAQAAGAALAWTDIAIDYGQRPNAVLNAERRRRDAQQGGRLVIPSNQRGE